MRADFNAFGSLLFMWVAKLIDLTLKFNKSVKLFIFASDNVFLCRSTGQVAVSERSAQRYRRSCHPSLLSLPHLDGRGMYSQINTK
jgi:hypothetical protein